jgi:hypothetical protein
MSANGRSVAFSSPQKVFLLDGQTGRITRIAVAPAHSWVVNAVLRPNAIWWAVATETPGSHGDADNPVDYTTTFYEQPR